MKDRYTALEAWSVAVSPRTVWIFVRLVSAAGFEGWGEATRFGEEAEIAAEIARARARLSGVEATPAAALDAVRTAPLPTARRAVLAAIEQAAFDLVARRAGLSLAALLGGPWRRRVAFYANINRGTLDRTPAGFAARARAIAARGVYAGFKIAPFDGLDPALCASAEGRALIATGVDRILATREAIGPAARLMADCHWRLTPAAAREVLRASEAAGLYWLEDALDEAGIAAAERRALRGFANDRGVRIAGGERLESLAEMRVFLDDGHCDLTLPDLRYTGLQEGLAMLRLASACGVAASLHNPVGPTLDAISLQAAASLPDFLVLEGQVEESPLFEAIAGAPRTLEQGEYVLPEGPGVGVAFAMSDTAHAL